MFLIIHQIHIYFGGTHLELVISNSKSETKISQCRCNPIILPYFKDHILARMQL